MPRRSFEQPPFVVWLIPGRDQNESDHARGIATFAKFRRWVLSRGESDAIALQSPEAAQPQYRLVPHAVFRSMLIQGLLQCVPLAMVIGYLLSKDNIRCAACRSWSPVLCGLGYFGLGLIAFLSLAIAANVFVLTRLNARSMQTVEALLLLCPREARPVYDSWFPSIKHSRWPFARPLCISFHTLAFFVCSWILPSHRASRKATYRLGYTSLRLIRLWLGRVTYGVRTAFAKPYAWLALLFARQGKLRLHKEVKRQIRREAKARAAAKRRGNREWHTVRHSPSGLMAQERQPLQNGPFGLKANFAKLGALTLRREDSSLHAFSAFAAVTFFVPHHRGQGSIPQTHNNFLVSYFSPIGFGFFLCLIFFSIYPVGVWLNQDSLFRFPFMACVFVWFVYGLFYLAFTLRQDFAALFRNYFDTRMFPVSMTQFANRQIAAAPDLVAAVQNAWVPWLIVTVMFGLAGLYAGFLQSL